MLSLLLIFIFVLTLLSNYTSHKNPLKVITNAISDSPILMSIILLSKITSYSSSNNIFIN